MRVTSALLLVYYTILLASKVLLVWGAHSPRCGYLSFCNLMALGLVVSFVSGALVSACIAFFSVSCLPFGCIISSDCLVLLGQTTVAAPCTFLGFFLLAHQRYHFSRFCSLQRLEGVALGA
ncbi:hypothetical protein M011DRAFT_154141 [Sporormia fimetaria CBS 119925]|uniref:Uncharacterized protein n=1 Tax=Sporormia fimetaria CBS 119925 TaxID=1340428 RepID=A0A6A6V720_9PLEO|nr:hypothetical protein M011DRAFT_154141 [Sporormia fimetaria CBS 119925]